MRQFSRSTNEEPPVDYVVLGGNHVGEAVAKRLQTAGSTVRVVTEVPRETTLPSVDGDPAKLSTLEDATVADAGTVIVATDTDARNLLVAQLVRANFDVPRVFVLTNQPDRVDSVDAAGHEPVCATTAIADAVVEEL
jgi:trk system potassium uptake protein TrkA